MGKKSVVMAEAYTWSSLNYTACVSVRRPAQYIFVNVSKRVPINDVAASLCELVIMT